MLVEIQVNIECAQCGAKQNYFDTDFDYVTETISDFLTDSTTYFDDKGWQIDIDHCYCPEHRTEDKDA